MSKGFFARVLCVPAVVGQKFAAFDAAVSSTVFDNAWLKKVSKFKLPGVVCLAPWCLGQAKLTCSAPNSCQPTLSHVQSLFGLARAAAFPGHPQPTTVCQKGLLQTGRTVETGKAAAPGNSLMLQ